MPIRRAVLFSCLLLAFSATAAAEPPKLTGKKWLDMDYGPFFSNTIELPRPEANFAYKGIAIPLGKRIDVDAAEHTMLFDTDTLRWAGGWAGGVTLTGVTFDGAHWAYPKSPKSLAFVNVVGPGWAKPLAGAKTAATAKSKVFDDPRFRGHDKRPYGPLPRDWGKWNGLYLHGDDVVFSYTIGTAAVLEQAGLETLGGEPVFTRTLNLNGKHDALVMRVCAQDLPGGQSGQKGNRNWVTHLRRDEPKAGEPNEAMLIACVSENVAILSDGGREAGGDVLLNIDAASDTNIKVLIWRGPTEKLGAVRDAIESVKPAADLTPLTKGGPPRFPKAITTTAKLGAPRKGSPWVTDTLTAPDDNPWQSWMRFGGFDFFKDGQRAAVGTWSGDVWIVSGIKPGAELGELSWKRIATGLFQPLGVRIVDEQIYVCCRDQITRLVDLNGDGETDFYEAFNHDHQVTEHFHEFAMDLQTDAEGNFYYAKSARHARDSLVEQHGTLMKISKDGKTSQILANGYRAANGVGVSPDGSFFTSDQEGHWMPANRINLVQPGSFSGNMFSYHRGEKPTDYDRPIVWLPKGFDRSPAEQVVVPDDRWGLPKGSVLSLSYGTGNILSIMYERITGVPRVNAQGAAFRIGVQFPTGIMRGRFHPADGQLYTCGLFGWSSDRPNAGGFYRVRYTGEKVHQPTRWQVAKDGIVMRFINPLDKEVAEDAASYLVEQWDYKWTANYGSPEFKLSDGQKGRDTLKLAGVTLSKDGRSVFLKIADFKPSMQLRIQYSLESADGEAVKHDVYGSVHTIPADAGNMLLEAKK